MPRPSTGYLKMIGGVWHVRLSKGSGKNRERPWYSLGTDDKRTAERRRKQLLAQVAAGIDPAKASAAMPQAMTVAEFAASWNEKRTAQGVVSAGDDAQRLRDYALPTIGSKHLGDVRAKDLNAVLDGAILAGKSAQTIKHIRAAMTRLFKAAWRAELIQENPAAKVELPKMPQNELAPVILTDDEFTQLIAYLTERVAKVDAWEAEHGRPTKRDGSRELRMLCACARILGGMRTSDVNRWDWQQIDLIHFAHVVVPRTKTKAPQDLGVPDELRHILRDWWEASGRPTSGPVFPARRGANAGGYKAERGISYAARLRRECRRAGLTRPELYKNTRRTRRLDFHGFRRAFASALANAAEVTMQNAMKLTAHKDARTHLRYVAGVTEIPAIAIPNLGLTPLALASADGQSTEEGSEPARHSGFEPLAFGSGGRRSDSARSRQTARDKRQPGADGGDDPPGSPELEPDWPSLASASGFAGAIRPRVSPHRSERAGRSLEEALRVVMGPGPVRVREERVLELLASAAGDLGLTGTSDSASSRGAAGGGR